MNRGRAATAGLAAVASAVALAVTAPGASAAESLAVTPRCAGGAATAVALTGAELPPGETLRVTVDDTQIGFVTPDAGGQVSASLPVPALPDQLHVISVAQDVSLEGPAVWEAVTSAPYQVPCPSVTSVPGQLAQRAGPLRLNLRALGFVVPELSVVFRLDGAVVASGLADATGQVRVVADLPAVPACGSHPIEVDQPKAPNALLTTARAALMVSCPTLQADPPSLPESALPTTVTVTGLGWDPKTEVALTVDGASGPHVITDPAGSFSVPVPVGPRPCGGVVPVIGTELFPGVPAGVAGPPPSVPAPTASTSVAVTCTPTPTPTPNATPTVEPPGPEPTLGADQVVASGGLVRATGSGFLPGGTVTLSWLMPDATSAPGTTTVVADAKGRFAVPCLVLPHARLGARTLLAEQPGTGSASAPVLVVSGPMEPGRSRLLGRR